MKNLNVLQKELTEGLHSSVFQAIYMEENLVKDQEERYLALMESFREHFSDADVGVFSVPGRTEIGGNHTDHQLGNVIAASISLDAVAVGA